MNGAAPDPWKEMAKRREAREAATKAAAEKAAEAPGFTLGLGKDPIEQGVNWAAAKLPAATPDWLRMAGRFVIPQNAPEAAATAALMALGGPLGAAGKGVLPLVGRILSRTAASGGAAAGAAALTGHDPLTHGVLGAVGGGMGETGGQIGRALVQRATVNRMVSSASDRLSSEMRGLVGFDHLGYLDVKPAEVFRRVMTGAPIKKLTKEIADIGYAGTPPGIRVAPTAEVVAALQALPPEIARKAQSHSTPAGHQLQSKLLDFGPLWEHTPALRPYLSMLLTPDAKQRFTDLTARTQRADVLQRWMTGGAKDPEKVAARLFDEQGRLTASGLGELSTRLGRMQEEMVQQLGPAGAETLARALYRDLASGFEHAVSGSGPRIRPHFGGWKSHAADAVSGMRLPWAPGWESQAGPVAHLAPQAIRAILAPVPGKLAPEEAR